MTAPIAIIDRATARVDQMLTGVTFQLANQAVPDLTYEQRLQRARRRAALEAVTYVDDSEEPDLEIDPDETPCKACGKMVDWHWTFSCRHCGYSVEVYQAE